MRKIRVLVVDDLKMISDMFKLTLGYCGHEVVCCANGEQAITALDEQSFDVVFLDVIMPEKDGAQVLEYINAMSPQLPVIMMSGYSAEIQRRRIRQLKSAAFLNKPFTVADVRNVVSHALGEEIDVFQRKS